MHGAVLINRDCGKRTFRDKSLPPQQSRIGMRDVLCALSACVPILLSDAILLSCMGFDKSTPADDRLMGEGRVSDHFESIAPHSVQPWGACQLSGRGKGQEKANRVSVCTGLRTRNIDHARCAGGVCGK